MRSDWQPVLDVPHLSHDDSWDRLQPPDNPELNKQKKMNGYNIGAYIMNLEQSALALAAVAFWDMTIR